MSLSAGFGERMSCDLYQHYTNQVLEYSKISRLSGVADLLGNFSYLSSKTALRVGAFIVRVALLIKTIPEALCGGTEVRTSLVKRCKLVGLSTKRLILTPCVLIPMAILASLGKIMGGKGMQQDCVEILQKIHEVNKTHDLREARIEWGEEGSFLNRDLSHWDSFMEKSLPFIQKENIDKMYRSCWDSILQRFYTSDDSSLVGIGSFHISNHPYPFRLSFAQYSSLARHWFENILSEDRTFEEQCQLVEQALGRLQQGRDLVYASTPRYIKTAALRLLFPQAERYREGQLAHFIEAQPRERFDSASFLYTEVQKYRNGLKSDQLEQFDEELESLYNVPFLMQLAVCSRMTMEEDVSIRNLPTFLRLDQIATLQEKFRALPPKEQEHFKLPMDQLEGLFDSSLKDEKGKKGFLSEEELKLWNDLRAIANEGIQGNHAFNRTLGSLSNRLTSEKERAQII